MNTENKKKIRFLIESLVEIEKESLLKEGLEDEPLIRAFVQPFTDIFKTAKAEAEKLSATVLINVSKLAKQIAVLAIPILAVGMINDISKKSKQKLKQRHGDIMKRYSDVYERTQQALKNRDVWGLTFLLNPSVGLGTKLAIQHAPAATLGFLEVLTGGNPKISQLKQNIRRITSPITTKPGEVGDYYGDIGSAMFGGEFGESIEYVTEQPLQIQQKDLVTQIQLLIQSPEIQAAIQKSPITKQFQEIAFESIEEALSPVLNAKTYEQLEAAIGPDFAKFDEEFQKQLPKSATPEQIEDIKKNAIPEIKQLYKQMLLQQMLKLPGMAPGISETLKKVIEQIKAL